MIQRLVDVLIAFAKRRAHPEGHIYNDHGDLYMARWSLVELPFLRIRVHHIVRPDDDRHLHDHPWDWVSIVLRGGYVELRPASSTPCFNPRVDEEYTVWKWRFRGSVAFRRASDRHRISTVMPETYTLFIVGGRRQSWGFFTRAGKVHWQDYQKVGREG